MKYNNRLIYSEDFLSMIIVLVDTDQYFFIMNTVI